MGFESFVRGWHLIWAVSPSGYIRTRRLRRVAHLEGKPWRAHDRGGDELVEDLGGAVEAELGLVFA